MLVGILIGLLLGLAIALAVAVYVYKVPGPFVSKGKGADPAPIAKTDPTKSQPAVKPSESTPAAKAEDKPRFDFYNILPGNEDAKKSKGTKDEPKAPATEVKEIFYLQAGAFQNVADADNMKARLALLGIEATIQVSSTPERGTFHRVRVGPYNRVEDVNRTRDTLKQNGIETTLIKGRDAQN
jgi:cell division protein FtsN